MASGKAQKPGVRAAKAAATRARMLAAARKLFIEHGYAGTSMQAIAKESGVAAQTPYYTFTTKRALLKELLDVEIAGDTAPIATLDRPWVAEAMAAEPADQLRQIAKATAAIHTRVAPLLDVIRSAAPTEPEAAELWRTNLFQRLTVQTAVVAALMAKTGLRDDLDAGRAADILLAVLAPETFLLFVQERGWTADEWAAWAADTLIHSLLPADLW
ncbi:TetR/AcrR family transcriptional regulator [Kribbella sp. NPDC004138]